MQLCMDSFTESSPEIQMQKFIQDLHRILHVDFGKRSAEICLQDFIRNRCIIAKTPQSLPSDGFSAELRRMLFCRTLQNSE